MRTRCEQLQTLIVPLLFDMYPSLLQFNFGQSGPCGDGDVIDNVKLPPWAPSAHEFVHMHREVRSRDSPTLIM